MVSPTGGRGDSLASLRARARARSGRYDQGFDDRLPSLLASPLGTPEAEELAAVVGALADPVRLRILSFLAAKGETCSCELAGPLGKSQPTVSHHTGILAAAGLITGDRRGRWIWWRIDEERLAAIRGALGG